MTTRTRPNRIQLGWMAAVAALGLIVTWQMSLSWPHNYDEGFNYLFFGERGFRFTVDNYTYPNNHILFSLIQAAIPRSLVDAEPLVLRIPNIFISAGLLVVLTAEIRRRWSSVPLALALVLAGPWSIIFFPVARGYQLGALLVAGTLLIVSGYPDERWTPPVAATLMALAAWTVPTFAFGAPVLTALWIARRRWRAAAVYSAVFVVLAFLLYLPVIDQLFGASAAGRNPRSGFTRFARDITGELFFLPDWAALIVVGIGGWALAEAGRRLLAGTDDIRARWTALLLGYPVVFVLVAELLPRFTDVTTPFFRNATFASLFIPAGIWASSLWSRPIVKILLVGLLVWNSILGLNLYLGVTDGSRIVDYEGTVVGQTPRLDRVLAGEDLAEIRCAWTDEWTCRLYEKHFEDRGVLVTPLVDTIEATECAVGRYPPVSGTGIDLMYRDGAKRLVCFD
ncbi:MAG: hypothetical protein HKN80_03145 [Acidimicrobiia bacterium]|nr:hypothetical protein [Acidimicrobiia bacterium]